MMEEAINIGLTCIAGKIAAIMRPRHLSNGPNLPGWTTRIIIIVMVFINLLDLHHPKFLYNININIRY
jgi:hypothetical protein